MNGFQLIEEKETDEEEDVFVFSKARSRLRFPTIHQGQTMSDTMAMDRLGFVDAIVALVAILLVVAPKKAFADIFNELLDFRGGVWVNKTIFSPTNTTNIVRTRFAGRREPHARRERYAQTFSETKTFRMRT